MEGSKEGTKLSCLNVRYGQWPNTVAVWRRFIHTGPGQLAVRLERTPHFSREAARVEQRRTSAPVLDWSTANAQRVELPMCWTGICDVVFALSISPSPPVLGRNGLPRPGSLASAGPRSLHAVGVREKVLVVATRSSVGSGCNTLTIARKRPQLRTNLREILCETIMCLPDTWPPHIACILKSSFLLVSKTPQTDGSGAPPWRFILHGSATRRCGLPPPTNWAWVVVVGPANAMMNKTTCHRLCCSCCFLRTECNTFNVPAVALGDYACLSVVVSMLHRLFLPEELSCIVNKTGAQVGSI